MNKISRKEILVLAGLTVIAAVLRVHNLGEWPVFGDEINTIVESRDLTDSTEFTGMNRWTRSTNPLSHLLIAFSFSLFGHSLFSARLVSVFFGILAIPVFFLLVRRLFDTRVAFLTVLFMTFSPNLVFISGYARYNSMLFFFGGVSFLLLLSGFAEGGLLRLISGFLLCLAAVLTHMTGVMVPGVFVLAAVVFAILVKAKRLRVLLAVGFVVVPSVVLAALFRDDLAWIWKVVVASFSGTGLVGYTPLRLIASVAYNDGALYLVFAFLATVLAVWDKQAEEVAVALYWFFPFVLVVVGSAWFSTGPRYLQSVMPGLYIMAALGVQPWLACIGRKSRIAELFLLGFIVAVQGPLLVSNWMDGGRYDTTSATGFIMECHEEARDEPVLAESHMIYEYLSGYSLDVQELPETLSGLIQELKGVESALLVFPLQRRIPIGFTGADYRMWIERNCRLLRTFGSNRFDFMRYEVAVYRYTGILKRDEMNGRSGG